MEIVRTSDRNRKLASYRSRGVWVTARCGLAATALFLTSIGPVPAQSLRQGVSAFKRQDYVAASRSFIPLAERGNAAAQSYLGYMFETGRGVPQNYTEAAMWYRRAAEQGDGLAQYSLREWKQRLFGAMRR